MNADGIDGKSAYHSAVKTRSEPPSYLAPYLTAAQKYGSGFGTLLWASPKTQAVRFKALLRPINVDGLSILDVGCGRADFLQYIFHCRQVPRIYTGLEAVEDLAAAAEAKRLPNCRIIRGDFVQNPELLANEADILFCSGALNTLDAPSFYSFIQTAFAAAGQMLIYNFLSSPLLAGTSYLTWHRPENVLAFARTLSNRVEMWDDYLRGDSTIAIWKELS